MFLFLSLSCSGLPVVKGQDFHVKENYLFKMDNLTAEEDQNFYYITVDSSSSVTDKTWLMRMYYIIRVVGDENSTQTIQTFFLQGHKESRTGYIKESSSPDAVRSYLGMYDLSGEGVEDFTLIVSTDDDSNLSYQISIFFFEADTDFHISWFQITLGMVIVVTLLAFEGRRRYRRKKGGLSAEIGMSTDIALSSLQDFLGPQSGTICPHCKGSIGRKGHPYRFKFVRFGIMHVDHEGIERPLVRRVMVAYCDKCNKLMGIRK